MAVYTAVQPRELEDFLARFDIGGLISFAGIASGVENSNFHLFTTKGRYILTLFERRTPPEDIPFCLSFMDHLRQKGVPCPGVVRTIAEEMVSTLCGKPAVITTFLPGNSALSATPEHCAAVGKTLAQMHLAALDFSAQRKNPVALPVWRRLIADCGAKAGTVALGLEAELAGELDFLARQLPAGGIPAGVVHADLFPDNVFFENGALSGVIDFYFSCTDFFAYDLMLTLNPWCFSANGTPDMKKSAALLSAYHRERPLAPDEIALLPLFGRAGALRIIATRLYDFLHPAAGALVTPKDPMEHVRILRFHKNVADTGAYGFSP